MPAPQPIRIRFGNDGILARAAAQLGEAQGEKELFAQQLARDTQLLAQSLQNQQQRRLAEMQFQLEQAKLDQFRQAQRTPSQSSARIITRQDFFPQQQQGQPEQLISPQQFQPPTFETQQQQQPTPSGFISGPAGRLNVEDFAPPQTNIVSTTPLAQSKTALFQQIARANNLFEGDIPQSIATLIADDGVTFSQFRSAINDTIQAQQRNQQRPPIVRPNSTVITQQDRVLRDKQNDISDEIERINKAFEERGISPFNPSATVQRPGSAGFFGGIGNFFSPGQPFTPSVSSQDPDLQFLIKRRAELEQQKEAIIRQREALSDSQNQSFFSDRSPDDRQQFPPSPPDSGPGNLQSDIDKLIKALNDTR